MLNIKVVLVLLVVSGLTFNRCNAAIILSFGNGGVVDLLPDTAGQTIEFSVSGGDSFDGLELDIQVGDGGVDLGGVMAGPTITGIDLTTNTIFSGHGPNQANVATFPLAIQSTVDTASLVTANGVIGRVTIDTTGVAPGDYDLLLTGVAGAFNTTFFSGANALTATVPNGTLRIAAIPEPSTVAILSAISAITVYRRRFKSRSRELV